MQRLDRPLRNAPEAAAGSKLALMAAGALVAAALVGPWLTQIPLERAALAAAVVLASLYGFVSGVFPRVRPIQAVTFGFALPYLGVAPIYQMAKQKAASLDSALMYETNASNLYFALVLNLCFVLAMLVGFHMGAARCRVGMSSPPVRAQVRMVLPWVYLSAAAALTPGAVEAAGGWSGLFTDRNTRADELNAAGITLAESGGASLALVGLLPTALSIAACYLFLFRLLTEARTNSWNRVPALHLLGFVIGAALLVVHANPLASSRFQFIFAVGSLALIWFIPRSGKAGLWLAAIILCATLVAYPLANVFRTDKMTLVAGAEAFATPDFDGFQQIVNAIAFTQAHGHSFGRYALAAIFFVIPRSLWTGKAFPASQDVAAFRGYVFTNLSLPVNAELYVEFGLLPMIAIVLVGAILLGRSDSTWQLAPGSRGAAMVPMLAMAMLGIVRGPLGSQAPVFLTIVGLVLIALREGPSASEGQDDAPTELALELPTYRTL
ncbi:oligosaccharide repeat unit polymerase [Mycobacterium sp. 3519A]|uniref:oligosaccharide repeat unit polymerase n=1 Tax=Mycobacterium sp. 3519A TaxID=2057184 RepID=UPI0011571433|nr:oligosaccharide repeat unit polymerase [Mycobacterium sp. 3519A]